MRGCEHVSKSRAKFESQDHGREGLSEPSRGNL